MKKEYGRWGVFLKEMSLYMDSAYVTEEQSGILKNVLEYAGKAGFTSAEQDRQVTEILLAAKIKKGESERKGDGHET